MTSLLLLRRKGLFLSFLFYILTKSSSSNARYISSSSPILKRRPILPNQKFRLDEDNCIENSCKNLNMKRQYETEPSLLSRTLYIPRGGSLQSEDDQSSSSIIITKVRNVIRSLLEIGDSKLPKVLSNMIRMSIAFVEDVTGVELLPKKKKKKTKQSKKKSVSKSASVSTKSASKTRKKKKSSDSAKTLPEVEAATANSEVEPKDEKIKAPKLSSSSSPTTKATAKPKPSKSSNKNSQQAHLARELKATSPNYRIQRELKAFIKSPPPNLRVSVGKNIRVWIITLKGADNTIYEGEKYRLRVSFPPNYPTVPPSMYFLNPTPRHEHVYTNGDICLSLLGKDWRPTMTAQSLAMSILSILSSAREKSLPMDNARHAVNKPGQAQDDWVYHDDNC